MPRDDHESVFFPLDVLQIDAVFVPTNPAVDRLADDPVAGEILTGMLISADVHHVTNLDGQIVGGLHGRRGASVALWTALDAGFGLISRMDAFS